MTIRYRANWTNATGGAGVSTFHAVNAAGGLALADAVRAFFNSMAGLLPSATTISFPGEADVISTATGELVDVETFNAPANVVGTSGGAYAAPTGASIKWVTNGIVRGHKVAGRTFIVPLTSGSFEGNGTLTAAAINTITTAANTLRLTLGPDLVIWSRPSANPGGDGAESAVTGNLVRDVAAVLRSRRD